MLWHLCDRHNPDYGCFPSQLRLAHDCEISRSTLNVHLDRLETAGLIRRVTCIDPVTKRQKPTRYFLGFEALPSPDDTDPGPETGPGFECDKGPVRAAAEIPSNTVDADMPCPELGHGAVSGFGPDPCPENGPGRVRNPDTNPVREPLRKPVKEEEDAQARQTASEELFEELLSALGFAPEATLPAWWQGWPARIHVRRWIDDLGLSEEQVIDTATGTRRNHPAPPDGPKALDRAMERAARAAAAPTAAAGTRRKRSVASKPPPSADELAAFYAGMVNSDDYLPPSTIGNRMRDELLARGLVTPERLRMRGVL